MANMSYCRFQNTDKDLADCQDALEGIFAGESAPMSREELHAAARLLGRCVDIVAFLADHLGVDFDPTDLERPGQIRELLTGGRPERD